MSTSPSIERVAVIGAGFMARESPRSPPSTAWTPCWRRPLKRPEYAPPPLLKRMVVSGHLGRKAGQGFYTY